MVSCQDTDELQNEAANLDLRVQGGEGGSRGDPYGLVEGAQKSRRRLDGHSQLPKLVLSVTFVDEIEVIAKPTHRQPTTAAA